MDERERIQRWNEREDLIDEVKATFGSEPGDLRRVLTALAHPDVIEYTRRYFVNLGNTHTCLHYEAPWNCASVTESNYDALVVAWQGPGTNTIFDEWCEPCHGRALNKKPSPLGDE